MLPIVQLGLRHYEEVQQIQQQLFDENIALKLEQRVAKQCIITCQHPPVFTLGKNGDAANVTGDVEKLGAKLIRTNRGGDVTFHGPGQLVVYPVLDLEALRLGIARYIFLLEQAVIEVLKEYGLEGTRLADAQGVWLDTENPFKVRKICAVGVKVSRSITMHGLAVNLNTDLRYFDLIIPCGLQNMGVTSLSKELGHVVDETLFEAQLIRSLQQLLA